MLTFKKISSNFGKDKGNYINSIIINLVTFYWFASFNICKRSNDKQILVFFFNNYLFTYLFKTLSFNKKLN